MSEFKQAGEVHVCEPGKVGHDRLKGGCGRQMGQIKTSRDIFASRLSWNNSL